MKKMMYALSLVLLAASSCQDNSKAPMRSGTPTKADDQNYEERRKQMNQKSSGGCCEAPSPAESAGPSQTAAADKS